MTRCTAILLTLSWLLVFRGMVSGASDGRALAADAPPDASAVGEMRTWTDSTGTRTIQAEYVSSTPQQVTLRLANGKKVTLWIDQLSSSDQGYVREAVAIRSSAKSGVGTATSRAAGGGNSSRPGSPVNAAAERPFAVCDVQIGMTPREVTRHLQPKGFKFDPEVDYSESAMNKFPGARPQKFVKELRAVRVDKAAGPAPPGKRTSKYARPPIATYIQITFMEDLPDHPGVGICTSVRFDKVIRVNLDEGPLVQQTIEELVARHGPFSKETEDHVVFGDEQGRFIQAQRDKIRIELRDIALEHRLEDAKSKIEAADTRPVETDAGPLDY
jgi:hypothetical protein